MKIDQHFLKIALLLEEKIDSLKFVMMNGHPLKMEPSYSIQIAIFSFDDHLVEIVFENDGKKDLISMPQNSNASNEFKIDQINEIRKSIMDCVNNDWNITPY
jgi:hypothetical protein